MNGTYGVDTISTLLLGVLNFVEIPFWLASLSFNVVVVIVTYVVDKQELGLGSLINALGIGVALKFLDPMMFEVSSLVPYYSVLASIFGPLFIGVGGAVYVYSGLGAAALEALTNLIYRKTDLTIKVIRMILDGSLVLSGFLLGGPVGLATIFCVLFIGPTLEFTLNLLNAK